VFARDDLLALPIDAVVLNRSTASRSINPMSDVTCILSAIEQGDPKASEQLLPLVYDELRRLARDKMAQERPGQTLQATALVHEAYLRLVDRERVQRWDSRGHFFAAAAEAMRRILVEQARRKQRIKRGGDFQRVEIDETEIAMVGPGDDPIALDEALTRLAEKHPEKAELVKLRYFAGLTVTEAAQALGISTTTADRHWTYARAWLFRELSVADDAEPRPGPIEESL
jgi:RNA polymerase sigma factor (TIGR02999 family)